MVNSTNQPTSIEWAMLFQWVLATTLGWLLGLIFFGELGIGVAVGLAQWLVLRQVIRRAGWWILASTVGWGIGWAIIVTGLVVPPNGTGLTALISGAILGIYIGLAQWIVLRRNVAQAGWWLPASIAGWMMGLLGLFGTILTGAVVGVVTGLMLDWLLRTPLPDLQQ